MSGSLMPPQSNTDYNLNVVVNQQNDEGASVRCEQPSWDVHCVNWKKCVHYKNTQGVFFSQHMRLFAPFLINQGTGHLQ